MQVELGGSSKVKITLRQKLLLRRGLELAGCLGRVSTLGGYSVTCGLTLVWIF
jgi:hypothetical protein